MDKNWSAPADIDGNVEDDHQKGFANTENYSSTD